MPRGGRPLALKSRLSRSSAAPPGGRHFEGVGRTLPQFCTLLSTLRQQRIRWPGHNGRLSRSAWPVFRMAPQRGPSTRDDEPDSVTKSSKLCRIGRRDSYGVAIKRHGLTPPGRQRWRRKRCEPAFARRINSSAKPARSLPGRAPLEGSEEDAAGRGQNVLAQARAVLEAVAGISLCRRDRRGGLPGWYLGGQERRRARRLPTRARARGASGPERIGRVVDDADGEDPAPS